MPILVPNFENPMLNRVAQGDMSIFEEGHDFTLTERKGWGDWNALIVASAKGYLNLVNRLLEVEAVRAHAAADDNIALKFSADQGYLEVVNRLLKIDEVRAKITAGNSWALRWAARNGHLEVVSRLLEIDTVRANATADSNGALRWAAEKGHLKVVSCLLKMTEVKANATAEHNQALRCAARNGHLEVVNRLLEIDEVRASTAEDNYALGCAAQYGHLAVVNRLLEIEAVRANTTMSNNQVLRCAAANGHSEVVHTLAKAQWPSGKQDMLEEVQQYLPIIKAGAQLYTAKREQERILIRALQNEQVVSTTSLYTSSSLEDDPRAHRLFTLPRDMKDNIASYAVYEGQSLAEQIRKDDCQNAWNDMRRSERLYGLFANTKKRSREDQLDCRACKTHKVG